MLTLYRAMNDEEANQTLKTKHLHYKTLYKHFTPSLYFIRYRVCNPKIYGNQHDNKRHHRILRFDLDEVSARFFTTNYDEWHLHAKKAHRVKILNIKEVNNEGNTDNRCKG